MMRHCDLTSGIGGFALGFQWAGLSYPVLFCDIEPWCRKILNKHWPDVPIAEDVKVLANDPDKHVPDCDILTAGYPCQPFSVAGARRGAEDDRHIWPEIFSIVKRKRPTWTVFENVYGHISMGIDEVLSDLEGQGYATRPFVIPAIAVEAPHRRDRVWIIGRNMADTDIIDRGAVKEPRKYKGETRGQSTSNSRSDVANTRREYGSQRNTTTLDKDTAERSSRSVHVEPGSKGQSTNVADSNDTRDRTSQRRIDTHRKEIVQRRQEQSQSRVSGHSTNVADTSGTRSEAWLSGQKSGQKGQSGKSDDSCCERSGGQKSGGRSVGSEFCSVVDGISPRLARFREHEGWEKEPDGMTRVAVGVPDRALKLKGLGNAILPQIAQRIGETIKQVEELNE